MVVSINSVTEGSISAHQNDITQVQAAELLENCLCAPYIMQSNKTWPECYQCTCIWCFCSICSDATLPLAKPPVAWCVNGRQVAQADLLTFSHIITSLLSFLFPVLTESGPKSTAELCLMLGHLYAIRETWSLFLTLLISYQLSMDILPG